MRSLRKAHLFPLLIGWLLVTGALRVPAASAMKGGGSLPSPEELVPADLNIRGVGKAEVEIVYRSNTAFVPIVKLFDLLKIRIQYDPVRSQAEGIFLTRDTTFTIDGVASTIRVGNRRMSLDASMFIAAEKEMYLTPDVYQRMFDLELTYNPRRISLSLKTHHTLPVIAEREREKRRRRFMTDQKLPTPDVEFGLQRFLIDAGRLDWNVISTAGSNFLPSGSMALRYGGSLLMGDLQLEMRQQTRRQFDVENIHGRLRYPFLDDSPVKQIVLGEIIPATQNPNLVLGVEVTNRPAKRRLLFSRDLFSEAVGANREVEVFSSLGGMTFGRSLSDGLYSFEVPLVYGTNSSTITAYDEWGLDQITTYRIVIPQEMIPPGEVEYSAIAGKLRSFDYKNYGTGSVAWGVNSRLMIRSDIEFYDLGDPYRTFYPSLSFTTRITDNLIGDAVVSPFARSRGQLSLVYPSSASATVSYTRFGNDPLFNAGNAVNQLEASVSLPITISGAFLVTRSSARQTIYRFARTRAIEGGLSFSLFNLQPGISTSYSIYEPYGTGRTSDRWTTTLSFDARLRASFILRSLTVYDHRSKEFQYLSTEFGKNFSEGYQFSLFYDRNFIVQSSIFGLRFTVFLPFARYRATAARLTDGTILQQRLGGSMMFSPDGGDFYFENNPRRVGYGALVVEPFIDENGNGIREAQEPEVSNLRMRARSEVLGRRVENLGSGRLGFLSAAAFENYFLFVDQRRLDNPLWVPLFKGFSVVTEPNHVKFVNYPIVIGGVIRGRVEQEIGETRKPAGDLTVKLINLKDNSETTMKTFDSGEYEFYGVRPGSYRLTLDESELKPLNLSTGVLPREIEVRATPDGDVIDAVNFLLR